MFVLLCAFSKYNLLLLTGLLLPSFPSSWCSSASSCQAGSLPWPAQPLAVPAWSWDSRTLPGSGFAIQELSPHQVVVTSLCLHGLLYAAVQLFCHCFTCWPAGKGGSVVLVSSEKRLYLWTEIFTLDETRSTTSGRQIQSWHILQHTVIFLVVKNFPEAEQRGWSFCLKVNFTYEEARRDPQGRTTRSGGQFRAVLVKGCSWCARGGHSKAQFGSQDPCDVLL